MNAFATMNKIVYSTYVKKIQVNYDNRKACPLKCIECLLEPLECLYAQICARIA